MCTVSQWWEQCLWARRQDSGISRKQEVPGARWETHSNKSAYSCEQLGFPTTAAGETIKPVRKSKVLIPEKMSGVAHSRKSTRQTHRHKVLGIVLTFSHESGEKKNSAWNNRITILLQMSFSHCKSDENTSPTPLCLMFPYLLLICCHICFTWLVL